MDRTSSNAEGVLPPVPKPVAIALKALNSTLGKLRPKDVVEAARDPKSILHDCFEWNDTRAAEQWRLRQATLLIREVSITWVVPKGPRHVEAKITRPSEGKGKLPSNQPPPPRPAARTRVQSMRQALEDLLDVQRRFDFLNELADIRRAIAEFSKKVVDAERRSRN